MSFLEKAGKVGKTVAKGTASYLESESRSKSRNRKFDDETRQEFEDYADRMNDIKNYFDD